jgi:hypothetical protein
MNDQKIKGLITLLHDTVSCIAATKYHKIVAPKTIGAANSIKDELIEAIEAIRDRLQARENDLVLQATLNVDEYLIRFSINSHDIDFYKLAYFLCLRLSDEVGFTDAQSKICKMMSVYILDIFLRKDTEKAIGDDFVTKMCFSIYEGRDELDYGQYGIYSIFKVASKC